MRAPPCFEQPSQVLNELQDLLAVESFRIVPVDIRKLRVGASARARMGHHIAIGSRSTSMRSVELGSRELHAERNTCRTAKTAAQGTRQSVAPFSSAGFAPCGRPSWLIGIHGEHTPFRYLKLMFERSASTQLSERSE